MTATILVVDDLLPNVKLLEVKLTNEYYNVITARSGQEALDLVGENHVDVILLDVMMPGMDGFEVCRKLKHNPATAYIPVVMVTALTELESRIEGLEAGAEDFLTKPINDIALFARIRSLVRLKVMLDELKIRGETQAGFGIDHQESKLLEPSISGAKILLLDDDAVQAKHISAKLNEIENCNIIITDDIQKSLDIVADGSFDLLIVSTQLVQGDGLRFCSQVRGQIVSRHVPILILVEEGETNIAVKGLDMGVNDYILSPIEPSEVIARVKTQIRRKRYQDMLKTDLQDTVNAAVKDGLTGLYNRRYFDLHFKNLVEQARTNNKPLCIMMLDLDHFKSVNDTHGHPAGDYVLKETANCIKHSVRDTDLVARYGGEEFVVILPGTNLEQAKMVAERIRSSIEGTTYKISPETTLNKTTSIGVSELLPEEKGEALIARTDGRLYKAKETGRNKVVSDD